MRDVRKTREEEDWKKKKTIDRGGWKLISDEAVKKLRAAPHKGKRGRERGIELVSRACMKINSAQLRKISSSAGVTSQ